MPPAPELAAELALELALELAGPLAPEPPSPPVPEDALADAPGPEGPVVEVELGSSEPQPTWIEREPRRQNDSSLGTALSFA
jgi:hypothetical protein